MGPTPSESLLSHFNCLWIRGLLGGGGGIHFTIRWPDSRESPERSRTEIPFCESQIRAFAKGAFCANLSQIARQIGAKWPVFRFVHRTKGAQNCRKFGCQFRTILCKYPFSNAPFLKFLIFQEPKLAEPGTCSRNTQEPLSAQDSGPSCMDLNTRTARTAPCANRNRTEPGPSCNLRNQMRRPPFCYHTFKHAPTNLL